MSMSAGDSASRRTRALHQVRKQSAPSCPNAEDSPSFLAVAEAFETPVLDCQQLSGVRGIVKSSLSLNRSRDPHEQAQAASPNLFTEISRSLAAAEH